MQGTILAPAAQLQAQLQSAQRPTFRNFTMVKLDRRPRQTGFRRQRGRLGPEPATWPPQESNVCRLPCIP